MPGGTKRRPGGGKRKSLVTMSVPGVATAQSQSGALLPLGLAGAEG
jgi:hypothetical protein